MQECKHFTKLDAKMVLPKKMLHSENKSGKKCHTKKRSLVEMCGVGTCGDCGRGMGDFDTGGGGGGPG